MSQFEQDWLTPPPDHLLRELPQPTPFRFNLNNTDGSLGINIVSGYNLALIADSLNHFPVSDAIHHLVEPGTFGVISTIAILATYLAPPAVISIVIEYVRQESDYHRNRRTYLNSEYRHA